MEVEGEQGRGRVESKQSHSGGIVYIKDLCRRGVRGNFKREIMSGEGMKRSDYRGK